MLFDDSIEKDAAIGGTIILTELVRINGKEGNLTVTTNGLLLTVKSKQTAGIHLNWPEVICVKSVNKKSETGVFIIHYIHHGAKNILQVKTLKIAESSEQWINIVNQELKATQRPKKLFVVINPIGGAGKGQQIYNKTVEPLFRLAEIKTSVVVTERSKQALEIGECTDFSQYDGIVVIGGDGLYQEILQGLSLQEQKKTGIKYDNFEEDLSKLSLPIGIIPAGTGNGFTQFINGALDVTTAALNIIRGEQYRANIFAVYSNNKFLCVSGFMFGYGMFTSSMKRAEELRWMKQFRYAVVISEFLFKKRILFQGELHYRLCGEKTRVSIMALLQCGLLVTKNGELFTLTYGALVAQLIKDYENDEQVNKQLDKMGYNMGVRLIEDFLARANMGRCNDFRETADAIAKVAFKMYLGLTPVVSNWSAAGDEFSLLFESNPLTDFVELPPGHANLNYSNLMCGVLRGALEMVQMDVDVRFIQDTLKGDNITEIRLKFNKRLEDAVPVGED
ncbi:Trafficking protein particle complex subunit 3 [Bulinus truncatus]|nr:Trafficking protein particle complex subunit 3 [Bulinus truncatus]